MRIILNLILDLLRAKKIVLMRNITLFVCLLFLVTAGCGKDPVKEEPDPAETKLHTHTAVIENIGANCPGYYVGLPGSYEENERKYPLLISFHGFGALGGITKFDTIVSYSVGKLLQDGVFPKNVVSEGKNYSFIVVTPRFRQRPTSGDAKEVLDYIRSRYRIDDSRIYMAGASMGGTTAFEFAGDYPDEIAAAVPFAAARKITETQAIRIAGANVPVWAFHNEQDTVASVQNTIYNVNLINLHGPATPALSTIWVESKFGGDHHDAWTQACDPGYKENGKNIYEWMLQYKK